MCVNTRPWFLLLSVQCACVHAQEPCARVHATQRALVAVAERVKEKHGVSSDFYSGHGRSVVVWCPDARTLRLLQHNLFQGRPRFRRATTDRRVAPLSRLFSGSEYPLQTTGRLQDWECYWTSRPLTRLWLRSRLRLWPETLWSPRVPRDQVWLL